MRWLVVLKCCTSHYVSWVPLVRNPRSSTFWHPFFERVSKRVDCWKASLFSSWCSVFFSAKFFRVGFPWFKYVSPAFCFIFSPFDLSSESCKLPAAYYVFISSSSLNNVPSTIRQRLLDVFLLTGFHYLEALKYSCYSLRVIR